MVLFAAVLAALALDAAQADEASAAAVQTPPATEQKADGARADRVVCRTQAVTGSRFTHRVCESEASARLRRQEERQALERAQTQRPYIAP